MLIEWIKTFAITIQVVAIFLMIVPMIYKGILTKRPMLHVNINANAKRGLSFIWRQIFIIYKVVVMIWFASTIIGLFSMIYFYIFNIITLRTLAKEQKELKPYIYNPFKQYYAYYRILYADKNEANLSYSNFSLGYWILLPFFLNSDSIILAFLGSTIFHQLWPTLLLTKIIYSRRPTSWGIKQHMPFILQIITLNGLGPILAAYTVTRNPR